MILEEVDIVIFDTDIFIWIEKGDKKAALIFEKASERYISVQTYMELLQGARNKKEQLLIKDFLQEFSVKTIPLTENIGHRASIYIEEYSMSNGLRSADSIIAATAVENNLTLVSSNAKHYKIIADLKFKKFIPTNIK